MWAAMTEQRPFVAACFEESSWFCDISLFFSWTYHKKLLYLSAKSIVMGKFINPFTDVGFKIVFGEEFSKPNLLDFLNALFDGERVIANVSFLDKEQKAMFDGDRSRM